MLDLNDLDTDDIPGITRERGNDLAQAGAVCLEKQGHSQRAPFTVRGSFRKVYTLVWPPATDQAKRTWNDLAEAAEHGAAGIAALLAIREVGYSPLLRSRKRTGFDYWLGDRDLSNVSEAERTATMRLREELRDDTLVVRVRLEVSGINNGDDRRVRARRNARLRQMSRSDTSGLPAYVVVIEFGRPLAEVRQK